MPESGSAPSRLRKCRGDIHVGLSRYCSDLWLPRRPAGFQEAVLSGSRRQVGGRAMRPTSHRRGCSLRPMCWLRLYCHCRALSLSQCRESRLRRPSRRAGRGRRRACRRPLLSSLRVLFRIGPASLPGSVCRGGIRHHNTPRFQSVRWRFQSLRQAQVAVAALSHQRSSRPDSHPARRSAA